MRDDHEPPPITAPMRVPCYRGRAAHATFACGRGDRIAVVFAALHESLVGTKLTYGVRVTGWPVGTFVRGRRVMWQGELLTPSTGEPVRFLETLRA